MREKTSHACLHWTGKPLRVPGLSCVLEPLFEYFHGSPLALFGLLGVLILCGVGLPIPEDIILITAGLIAGESNLSWVHTSVLMYFGIIAGDSLVFGIGRHFGCRLLEQRWAHRMLSGEKRDRIRRMFERYGITVFFVARFLPGLRAPIYCTAGAMRASYGKFVLIDSLAALISVPAFVWLGHWIWTRFGDDLAQVSGALSRGHSLTLVVGAVCIAAVIGFTCFALRKSERA